MTDSPMKSLLALAAAILFLVCLPGRSEAGEMRIRMKPAPRAMRQPGRALWVVRTSLLSRAGIDRMLDQADRAGFNNLFVQVCGRGDAYFPSHVFPPAEDYARKVGGAYDPLAYLLEKAHVRGLGVHAWVNTLLVWSSSTLPSDRTHLLNAHPGWSMVDTRGRHMSEYQSREFTRLRIEGVFRSLAEPESARELEKFLLDLVSRYQLDGLHLDYIRYPMSTVDFSLTARKEFAAGHGDIDPLELYTRREELAAKLGGENCGALLGQWLEFRAELITRFVRTLRGHLLTVRPELRLSAAVKPDIDSAYRVYGQDWPCWVREGQMDFVVPMAYSTNTQVVFNQVEAACRAVGPEHVWAGIRAWAVPVSGVLERARRLETLGAGGIVFFSYNGVENNTVFFNSVRQSLFRP